MPNRPIPQIKSAIPLRSYVSRYITLKNWYAQCPFHHEKTASFHVAAAYFKCFGCGVSGDLVTFASLYHQIPIGEAIRMLAVEAGIQLTRIPVSPREAILRERHATESAEWYAQCRSAVLTAMLADDYDRILPFLTAIESMTAQQRTTAYMAQRTPEQASLLRAAAAQRAKPTVESLVREFLAWTR